SGNVHAVDRRAANTNLRTSLRIEDEQDQLRYEPSTRPSRALEVLCALDRAGVTYCHWKSNEHLQAALDAETDLDLLVDAAKIDAFYQVLGELSFRRGRVAPSRNDVGLEDFLGIDPLTRRLVHFHVHYRLATGEPRLKRFRLPWERVVLDTRVRDPSGVWITAPALEVVLLVVRQALKLRARDVVWKAVRRGERPATGREYEYLLARTSIDDVLTYADQLLGERGRAAIARFL